MPGEEWIRGPERCGVHSAVPSVAECDDCGRGLCLACAIPVRGRTLGVECLATAVGAGAPVQPLEERMPGTRARTLAAAAFGLTVLATLLPWSRFGRGAEPFGAWGATPSWSVLAGVAAVVGLAACLLYRLRPLTRRTWQGVATTAGAVLLAASALSLARPPAFTSPWLGPWLSLGAGVVAVAASLSWLRGAERRSVAVVAVERRAPERRA